MVHGDLDELFHKFLRNDMTGRELRLFQKMAGDPANRSRLDALLKDLFETPSFISESGDIDELFDSFLKRAGRRAVSESSSARILPFSKRAWRFTAAACAALLISGSAVLLYLHHDVRAPGNPLVISARKGERKDITLPDGSRVRINAGSTLTLADGFNLSSRAITLSGEAYFNIAKNKDMPFVIHTSSMNIKVLGTSFNIRAYPEECDEVAALIDGKILVTLTNGHGTSAGTDYYLSPLQKIVVAKDQPASEQAAAQNAVNIASEPSHIDSLEVSRLIDKIPETAWTDNVLFFNADPFSQVKEKLERWYGVKIRVDNETVGNLHFTGSYQNMTIGEVMEALHLANRGLNYKIENNEKLIVIY